VRRKIRRSGNCKVCSCEISLALRNSYVNKYGSIGTRCKSCTGRSQEELRELKYGVTPEAFAGMLESQLGGCAICAVPHQDGVKGKGLCVDHCHESGAVRGLLCRQCNSALGLLKDDPVKLRKAAEYLDENSGVFLWD